MLRRRLPFLPAVLALSAALVLVGALVLGFVRIDRVVVAAGRLQGGTTPVRAPFEGRVARVLAADGEAVRAGQPLVELESAELRLERERAEARLQALEARAASLEGARSQLVEVERPRSLRQAELDLELARVRAQSAERRAAALESLRGEGLVAELAYQDALAERRAAELAVEEARLARAATTSAQATRLEELDLELRLLALERQERQLEAADLAQREAAAALAAPSDGVLLPGTLAEVSDLVGRRVEAGAELLRVARGPAERFEGRVSDQGRPHVRPGLRARLRLEAYPWLLHGSVPGRVEVLAERSAEAGGFPVTIRLEPPSVGDRRRLVEGMRGEARILVEERVRLGRLLFERLVGASAP